MFSQKTQTKSWGKEGIENIEITAPWATQITFQSHPNNTAIMVSYKADGEYQRNVSLSSYIANKKLFIAEKQLPNFKQPNDKLSAHKAIATKLEIILPATTSTTLFAKDASIRFSGEIDTLNMTLEHGIVQFFGNVLTGTIQTISATVMIHNTEVKVSAESKTGTVRTLSLNGVQPQLQIQSISGNIIQQ